MPSNNKATNQYYGKFFETAVVAQLNNSEIEYNENYEFTDDEKTIMLKQAQEVANYLGEHTAQYVGNQTSLASGDIILDNQEAFRYGVLEEFGLRDDHFEEDGEIISRKTIEQSIDGGKAYRIMQNDQPVGGVVIKVDRDHGELELLFVSPKVHSKGIGYAAWCEVERMHPEVKVWETITPYFEKRNIHFYVNKCGFHIVEYINQYHPDPNEPEDFIGDGDEGMFVFRKQMK